MDTDKLMETLPIKKTAEGEDGENRVEKLKKYITDNKMS